MSTRYPGGLITKSPVVPTTTSAPGIWTLEQALEYIKAGTWPTGVDPYFEYVTLLLHGDGTNGAQNNTFLDSSTNNFTITRNGDTTQGAFSPFSRADGNWSNYFDGSGDFLNTNSLTLSGDFTVEAWVYMPSTSTAYCVIGVGDDFSGGFIFHTTNTGALRVFGNNAQVIVGSGTVTTNTWNHVAFVRSGSTNTLYLNGVSQGTATNSTSWSGTVRVGREIYAGNLGIEYLGYISNVRVVNGTAVYTGAFTPPTSPLTAIANTALLTCQSNRFKDNSTNAYTITPNGNVAVQVFNPFNPTAPYDTATNGGSGYFDGSGDTLTTPSSSTLAVGTGDFCVEMWVYRTATGNMGIYSNSASSGGGDAQFEIAVYNGNFILVGWFTIFLTSTTTVLTNTWYHVAVCRTGSNTLSMFVNGVREATTTSANNWSSTNAFYIGAQGSGSGPYSGYVSSLRVVKGSSPYDATQSTITIPTAPPTAITNTQLLTNFTNGGIFDNAAMNDMATVGNAQISTTQFKYGTGSMYFDGTGDQLNLPSSQNYAFGTGDYTVEFWLRLSTATASYPKIWMITSAVSSGTQVLGMQFGDSGYGYRMALYISDSYIDLSSSGVTQTTFLDTWKHVAMVRSSGTLKVYVDGTSVYSAANTTNFSGPYFLQVGGSHGYNINGYLDDFRLTKGYARYTDNFTPPVAPFPNK